MASGVARWLAGHAQRRGCYARPQGPNISARDTGLIWLTGPDAISLGTSANPIATYVLNLKLSNPAAAQAFVSRYGSSNSPAAPSMASWQGIAAADGLLVQDEQQVLAPGAWLAGLLALASVAVLAAGRMAERTRRVGLLKAVGGTPRFVSAILLAENLVLALVALAVLNVICATWATVLDTSRASALARALGSTPEEVSAGLTAAQVFPALPGALLGVPLGIGLFAAANGSGGRVLTVPPAWWLAAAVLGTLVAVAGLTIVPARIGARRPAAQILQSETP